MKNLYFLSILILIFVSCETDIVNPPIANYGITGRVLDEAGNAITGVKIYCLFNYYYFRNSETHISDYINIEVDSFSYSLGQNFPNPVNNSTFLRYSLETDADIELNITNQNSGLVVYTYIDHKYYGLHQHHFNELVDSLQLENGCYIISLKVVKDGFMMFQEERKMFVISDLGKANSVSDDKGIYYFDYNKSSINDTIYYTHDGQSIYPLEIDNSMNFIFKKDGYVTEYVSTKLYDGVLLNRDVLLLKEEIE